MEEMGLFVNKTDLKGGHRISPVEEIIEPPSRRLYRSSKRGWFGLDLGEAHK